MNALKKRREEDLQKLRALCAKSGGKIKIVLTSGDPVDLIRVELAYRTVATRTYPQEAHLRTLVELRLPPRYPLERSTVIVKTPIFHPNIWESGEICFGTQFLPTHGLDFLVRRIIGMITYDPSILNLKSPANSSASHWYVESLKQRPQLFPTDSVNLDEPAEANLVWTNIHSSCCE